MVFQLVKILTFFTRRTTIPSGKPLIVIFVQNLTSLSNHLLLKRILQQPNFLIIMYIELLNSSYTCILLVSKDNHVVSKLSCDYVIVNLSTKAGYKPCQ